MPLRAAALLDSLARGHPLVDGDERLAWLAAVVLLDLNGLAPDLTDDQAFRLVMDVSERHLEVADVAARLRVVPAT